MAPDLLSRAKCSATRATVIGATIAVPIPASELKRSIMVKLVERAQPMDETTKMRRPPMRSDLCLYLTLRAPISRAETTPTIEAAVLSCPTTPIGRPKVPPMSMSRRPTRSVDGCRAKRDITSDGRVSLPGEAPSETVSEAIDITPWVNVL